MGPSLCKRISKHTTEPTEEKVSSIASSSSTFLAAVDHLRTPTTTSKDNMASTPPPPPPPPPPMLPRKPEKLRCSPSKSLLHRYKSRSVAENAKSAPNSPKKVATTSPAPSHVTTRSRSKIPAFTENFEHSKSATELTTPPGVASTNSISSAVRTVSGVEFEMMSTLQPSLELPIRSKSAEPARARSADDGTKEEDTLQAQRKRDTRSETRETRSDSTVVDFDGTPKSQQKTAEPPSPRAESPRAQSTLKKKEKSNPITVTRPRIPRGNRTAIANAAKATTPTKSTIQLVANSSSSDSSESDDSDCEFILEHKTGTERNLTAKFDQQIQPTKVIPPIPVGYVLPGLLWASPLSGTSRPDSPWLWCKRWTCCRCSAATIVEQQICARLTCGHHRCGNQCKLAKERRVYMM